MHAGIHTGETCATAIRRSESLLKTTNYYKTSKGKRIQTTKIYFLHNEKLACSEPCRSLYNSRQLTGKEPEHSLAFNRWSGGRWFAGRPLQRCMSQTCRCLRGNSFYHNTAPHTELLATDYVRICIACLYGLINGYNRFLSIITVLLVDIVICLLLTVDLRLCALYLEPLLLTLSI